MFAFTSSEVCYPPANAARTARSLSDLLNGEILLTTQPYSAWGGAVTARMFLPLERSCVWALLTNYPRWVDYLPALSHSELLHQTSSTVKRLYQVASKNFLVFTAQVEIYLTVTETPQQRLQFALESGSFTDFTADLKLQDCEQGTLISYAVQATPTIPVPSLLIQQAIQFDLPTNLRHLRQVMCQSDVRD
jgi:ribosome-associated toxin RatA of RatAB toxin-antitoxin module